jgi:hypothetical protein
VPTQATIQSKIYRGYGQAAKRLGDSFYFYRPAPAPYLLTEQGRILRGENGMPLLAEPQSPLLSESGQYLQTDASPTLDAETGLPLQAESGQFLALDSTSQTQSQNLQSDMPPVYGMNPTADGTHYTSMLVSLNAEDMGYKRPNKYGKATWYALFDATNAQVGDYLISGGAPLLGENGQQLLAESGQGLVADVAYYSRSTYFIAAMQPLLPILVVECNRVIDVVRTAQTSAPGVTAYGGRQASTDTLLMQQWPASILQGPKGEKDEVGLPGDTRQPWWVVLLPYYLGVELRTGDRINDDLGRSYTLSSVELTDLGWRATAQQATS